MGSSELTDAKTDEIEDHTPYAFGVLSRIVRLAVSPFLILEWSQFLSDGN